MLPVAPVLLIVSSIWAIRVCLEIKGYMSRQRPKIPGVGTLASTFLPFPIRDQCIFKMCIKTVRYLKKKKGNEWMPYLRYIQDDGVQTADFCVMFLQQRSVRPLSNSPTLWGENTLKTAEPKVTLALLVSLAMCVRGISSSLKHNIIKCFMYLQKMHWRFPSAMVYFDFAVI